jgi:N-acetylglucosaminyldiphosphoundecaprenol N-acetyl-beta-D-mannosaminyltransferase
VWLAIADAKAQGRCDRPGLHIKLLEQSGQQMRINQANPIRQPSLLTKPTTISQGGKLHRVREALLLQANSPWNKQWGRQSINGFSWEILLWSSGVRPMVEVASVHNYRTAAAASDGLKHSFAVNDDLPVTTHDDLDREVYCILGLPIDAIEMPAVLRKIEVAATIRAPFVVSTPNINFLVASQTDVEFRESLLLSDLCPVDGMPVVWIARLLGIPIKNRVAGSDIFDALKSRPRSKQPLKIFLFGATEEIAAAASEHLNRDTGGLTCVGWICPGFGDLDQLSQRTFIDQINASGADFLVAALGAKKGQLWLQKNHARLQVPVRAHLGAVINFQAGTVKRAPHAMQKLGLEWLWRIKEEPVLWKRYWQDGMTLFRLLLTRVLPLAINARWLRLRGSHRHDFVIVQTENDHTVTLRLSGHAIADEITKAIACFREALATRKQIVIDFAGLRAADARFFGLLLMLRKQLKGRGAVPHFVGISSRLQRQFQRNGLEHILTSGGNNGASIVR